MEKNSTTYCLVPAFGPALANKDFVIDYIQRIIDDFWYPDDRAGFGNPMWRIFERADAELLQKLTGFMLRQLGSEILARMERSSGLPMVMVVPSRISTLLQQVLSWAWVPVLICLKTEHAHKSFRPISRNKFLTYQGPQIVLPKQTSFEIWTVKSEWKAAAMNTISTFTQHTIFWDEFKRFIHSVAMYKETIASSCPGETSVFSMDSLYSSIQSEHSIALQSEESLYPKESDGSLHTNESDGDSDTSESCSGSVSKHSDESLYRFIILMTIMPIPAQVNMCHCTILLVVMQTPARVNLFHHFPISILKNI